LSDSHASAVVSSGARARNSRRRATRAAPPLRRHAASSRTPPRSHVAVPGHGSHVLRRHVLRLLDLPPGLLQDFAAASQSIDVRWGAFNTASCWSAAGPWRWRFAARKLGSRSCSSSFYCLPCSLGQRSSASKPRNITTSYEEHHIPGLNFNFDASSSAIPSTL